METLCGRITDVYQQTIRLEESFEDLALRFSPMPGTVVLLSGGPLDCARYHILAARPWLTFQGRHHDLTLFAGGRNLSLKDNPFSVLRRIVHMLHLPHASVPTPVGAGLFGYLSYDLKDTLEVLPRTCMDSYGLPQICLYAPSIIIVYDKEQDSARLLIPLGEHPLPDVPDKALSTFERIRSTPSEETDRGRAAGTLQSNFSRTEYVEAVNRVKEYIAAGDVYQVNLSQNFQAAFSGDPFRLFMELFWKNPAPFFSYINAGDHHVLSTSPERFLFQNGRRVETRPIKGTRPRGRTPEEDQALKRTLEQSHKDEAELSMIVDLLRNDMGKVCIPGSVRVRQHKRIEAYRNVYHLVSIVEGLLSEEAGSVDMITASFPGGSITGCPKIRAMEIIDELEPTRRHVYTGAIGYVSFHDTMDLSIAIRTATLYKDTLNFSVGGGIVMDSNPEDEYDETLHKGQTLMHAFTSDKRRPEKEQFIWFNGMLKPAGKVTIPVTDEGFLFGYGFFETIRADRGRPHLLEDHLIRFNRTWTTLFSDSPPDLTWEEIIRHTLIRNNLSNTTAAVKIIATGGENPGLPFGHNVLVMARMYKHRLENSQARGLRLVTYPHRRETPLADYKTLNYLFYRLAGTWASERNADEALILNSDGSLSETNTGNLVVIRKDAVIRPSSKHVLPGVMQDAVCRLLSASGYTIMDETLTAEAFFAADGVFVTNSLIGAVPAVSVDGIPIKIHPTLEEKLATEIFVRNPD